MVQVVVINRVVLTASISCQNKSWINSSWESCISQTIKKIYLSSPWCILLLQREKKNSEKRGFSSFGGIKLARLNFFFIGGESVYNQLFYAKKKTFKVFVILNEVFESILGWKKKNKKFSTGVCDCHGFVRGRITDMKKNAGLNNHADTVVFLFCCDRTFWALGSMAIGCARISKAVVPWALDLRTRPFKVYGIPAGLRPDWM